MSEQLGGVASFPAVVGTYAAADAGDVGREETEARFVLDGVARYTLPYQLVDGLVTPTARLLTVASAGPGYSATVYSASPLSNFRAVVLQSLDDRATVSWSSDSKAWMLVTWSGPS